jgi:hypothetical protein
LATYGGHRPSAAINTTHATAATYAVSGGGYFAIVWCYGSNNFNVSIAGLSVTNGTGGTGVGPIYVGPGQSVSCTGAAGTYNVVGVLYTG